MKKLNLSCLLLLGIVTLSCGNRNRDNSNASVEIKQSVAELIAVEKDSLIKDLSGPVSLRFAYDEKGYPQKRVFAQAKDKNRCFIVISKQNPVHLNVYEAVDSDTVLLAAYPACVGQNWGQKVSQGDLRTPESYPGKPFYIDQIQNSSSWKHDFGDGRGSIPAYGKWFIRLITPGFTGIGIHGSTGNRESIRTGRGSEGCIRLLDEDIIHLKENYATKGANVIILPEDCGPLPFELRAFAKNNLVVQPVVVETGKIEEQKAAEDQAAEGAGSDAVVGAGSNVEAAGRNVGASENKVESPAVNVAEPAKNLESAPASRSSRWPSSVTVKGTRQRLREGPSPEYPIYPGGREPSICPDDGAVLPCLGESGNYYKVRFDGHVLYLNKASCSPNS